MKQLSRIWPSRIWKFTLRLVRNQTITMPFGADILSCQNQNGSIVLWAEVIVDELYNPDDGCDRTFLIFGTGEEIHRAGLTFVNTVQVGEEVWHVFENMPPIKRAK